MLSAEQIHPKTLDEILGPVGPDSQQVIDHFSNLVLCYLRSRYPERSAAAKRKLEQIWGHHMDVIGVETDGTMKAYVRIGANPLYVFVREYATNPLLEEIPDEEDRKTWESE